MAARKIFTGVSFDKVNWITIGTLDVPDVGEIVATPICPEGSTFKCVKDEVDHTCPDGQHWDEATQKCVVNTPPSPPPSECNEVGIKKEVGANTDPKTWKVVNMLNPSTCFKVVDDVNKNVITNFSTEAAAKKYIVDHSVVHTCPTGQHWDETEQKCVVDTVPTPGDGVDQFGIKTIYKSKPGGKVATNPDVRFFTRHYSSGKPDQPTVEATVDLGAKLTGQEATCIITMKGVVAQDTMDWKIAGGHHSSSNPKEGTCYDFEVETDGSAKKTLEVESPHPNNHAAHQKPLFTLPDMTNKTFGYKAIYLVKDKTAHLECWLNLDPLDTAGKPKNDGWKLYWKVDDTGQLYKPTSPIVTPYGTLATIRIDAIKGHPDFKFYSVREITA